MANRPRYSWEKPEKRPKRYLGLPAAVFDILVLALVFGGGAALWVFVFNSWTPGKDDIPNPPQIFERKRENFVPVVETGAPAKANTVEEAVQSAVLTLSDLPPGWRVDSSNEDLPFTLSGECAVLTQASGVPLAGLFGYFSPENDMVQDRHSPPGSRTSFVRPGTLFRSDRRRAHGR